MDVIQACLSPSETTMSAVPLLSSRSNPSDTHWIQARMTRALPRTNFNSSTLVRVLADMAVVDAPQSGPAFAEKLGLWLDFTDAIKLFSAHNAANSIAQSAVASVAGGDVGEVFAQVRAAVVKSITTSALPDAGQSRLKLPTPDAAAPIEIAAAYEPYRRYYLAHQRDMELKLGPLRSNVRAVLVRTSAELRQLAALDEALDGILSDHESKSLAAVSLLLEKRFEHLLASHRQQLVATGQADNPALWMQAGMWLATFCNELQTVLLAELDLRLQPALGLIEAFSNTK